jgi:hypothetical protein
LELSPQARPERTIQTGIDNFVWPFIGDRNLGNCTVPIAVDGTATGKVAEMGCASAVDTEREKVHKTQKRARIGAFCQMGNDISCLKCHVEQHLHHCRLQSRTQDSGI